MKTKVKDVCQIFCFNKEKVNKTRKTIASQKKLNAVLELFKIISDSTRTKILLALKNGELCVCDISLVLDLSLSAVSHQLRILRGLGLVKYRNAGKLVFYSLTDKHIIKLIEEGIKNIKKGGRK